MTTKDRRPAKNRVREHAIPSPTSSPLVEPDEQIPRLGLSPTLAIFYDINLSKQVAPRGRAVTKRTSFVDARTRKHVHHAGVA